METSSPPSGILEKSVMRRRYAGSIIFMVNKFEIRAEVLVASARPLRTFRLQIN
jgi:hypothetical protein